MKHIGSFEDLKAIVRNVGFVIDVGGQRGHFKQIRTHDGAIVNWFESTGTLQFQGKQQAREKLEQAFSDYKGLPADGTLPPEKTKSVRAPHPADSVPGKEVFVVHGQDGAANKQLGLILHRLGLKPLVLKNRPAEGLKSIEVLKGEASPHKNTARYGIVLMTPDDVGYSKGIGDPKPQPRAGQNVVLETGMLISSLGRANVVILKRGDLEVPSGTQGIFHIPFNENVKETVPKLVDILRAAGFVIEP
jgi:predicted nucleotide-binding protein